MNVDIHAIVRALATSMGARIFSMAMRFGTICLLPLMLSPSEIGWAAIVMGLTNILIALSDLGMGTALIKEKAVSTSLYHSVFTCITACAIIIAVALECAAPMISRIFSVPEICILVSTLAVPLGVMSVVPNAILQRELRFTGLAVRDLFGELAFSATALALAFLGASVLCVPCALVAHRMVRWVISSASVDYRPRLALDCAALKRILPFSVFQLGNLSVTQISSRLDTFLLSVFMPSSVLGFYSQAQQFSTVPVQTLSGTVCNVFFASFSKIQTDVEKMRVLFLRLSKALLGGALLGVALLYPALELIPLVYDAAWRPSVGVAHVLCLGIPAYAMESFNGVLITIGGERRRLAGALVRMGVTACGIVVLFTGFPEAASAQAVAYLVVLATALNIALNLHFIFYRLNISIKSLQCWVKPTVVGVMAFLASVILTRVFCRLL